MNQENIALLILAAGSSSRLGHPKQLVRRGEQLMINHIISECKASKLGPIYLVTGKYHQEIINHVKDITVLYNKFWDEGMSSSISFGVKQINKKNLRGIIIILSDQVYMSKKVLTKIKVLADTKNTKIINCKYQIGEGPPTYFDRSLFSELELLSGDHGAKCLLKKYITSRLFIDFPEGHIDIDHPQDLHKLKHL